MRKAALHLHTALFILTLAQIIFNPAPSQAGDTLVNLDPHAVWDFARSHSIQSVDEFVTYLPPEFKGQYLMVYDSRSLQPATPREPRIISYGTPLAGQRGDAVFAFSGINAGTETQSIEMFYFDRATHRHQFAEIALPAREVAPALNPQKCQACHGENPRPIFDNAPLWPGMIGSEMSFTHPYEIGLRDQFIKNQPNHPRYQALLPPPPLHNSVSGLTDFAAILKNQMSDIGTADLGTWLADSRLRKFRFAIAAVLDCDDSTFNQLINPASVAAFTQAAPRSYADIYTETQQTIYDHYFQRLKRHRALVGGRESLFEYDDLVTLYTTAI